MQTLDTERASEVPERGDDEEGHLDFKNMMTAEKGATSGIHTKLHEAQCVCDNGGKVGLQKLSNYSIWLVRASKLCA